MDKLEGQLDKVNERLKAFHYGVRIEMRGSRLSLVATLPPKPSSKKNANHQQRIALGLRFHAEGLKQAEIKAKEVSGDRDRQV
jgi:hypothetical protein